MRTERPRAFPRSLSPPSRSILLGLLPPPRVRESLSLPDPRKKHMAIGGLPHAQSQIQPWRGMGGCAGTYKSSPRRISTLTTRPGARERGGKFAVRHARLGTSLPTHRVISAVVYCVCSLASPSGSRLTALAPCSPDLLLISTGTAQRMTTIRR